MTEFYEASRRITEVWSEHQGDSDEYRSAVNDYIKAPLPVVPAVPVIPKAETGNQSLNQRLQVIFTKINQTIKTLHR